MPLRDLRFVCGAVDFFSAAQRGLHVRADVAAADVERIKRLLVRADLPTDTREVTVAAALEHMKMDKKVQGGRIRLVVPRAIGECFISADYSDAALQRTLAACFG